MTEAGMKIALIGTRGVPAQYGGFETAVEEVGARLAARGHTVTVFCRGHRERLESYKGIQLVHLPSVQRRTLDTLSHTALSVMHAALRDVDAAIVFNAANSPLIPILRLRRIPVAVHVDGLEWQRTKWGKIGRRYYLICERLSVLWGSRLIADARGIQSYYEAKYHLTPVFLPYGAPLIPAGRQEALAPLNIRVREYHLVVARFEPENHVLEAVQAYAESDCAFPLVVVGSAPYSADYTQRISAIASSDDRIRLVGAVWDQSLLDSLYAGALSYVHGHSVGGTNPSLLRAMGASAPVLAFDIVFNREVLDTAGRYWNSRGALSNLLEDSEKSTSSSADLGRAGRARAADLYNWDDVASGYELLCRELVGIRGR